MYILNTSFMVDYDVHDRWLELMRKHVAPFIREQGFDEPVFTRVLADNPEGHFTYSLQVPLPDMERYNEFTERVLGEYRTVAAPLFGQKVLAFSTLLKKESL